MYANFLQKTTCAILCAGLFGCVVGPNFKTPEPVPGTDNSKLFTREQLNNNSVDPSLKQSISADWWKSYRSPKIDRLVERAQKKNPNVDVAIANLKAAQEGVNAQRGLFFPAVSLGYNVNRQNNGAVISPTLASGQTIFTLHTAQLSVGFVPDIFGLNRRQVESLDALAVSQNYLLAASQISIATNVVAGAIQHAVLEDQIRVVNEAVAAGKTQLNYLQKLKDSGYSSGFDLATQEVTYAQALAQLPPLQKQLEQTKDLIAVLCGQLPNESFALPSLDEIAVPQSLPLILPSQLVDQRPDIQIAIEQVRSSNALIGVATANMLPQFSITGSLGFTKDMLVGLLSNDNRVWGVNGGILQPIFQGGALRARKRGAEAQKDAALAQYRVVVLTAFQNVADVLYALDTDARGLSANVQAEQASEKLFHMAQKQFDLGYSSGLNLLTVKQSYLQARLARIATYGTYLGDTVSLYQALGGGWTKAPD